MKSDNVINMMDRTQTPAQSERFKGLKMKMDLDQMKIAVSTSLLSILLLVTVANTNMTSTKEEPVQLQSLQSRGIASIPTGTSAAEDDLVRKLSNRKLGESASVGQKPSKLENLALGFLEGRYAVRTADGKLSELEFTSKGIDQSPKKIDNLSAFIEMNRELMPGDFSSMVKISQEKIAGKVVETFQLINRLSMPVAKVQFQLDSSGRLLAMRVSNSQVASK